MKQKYVCALNLTVLVFTLFFCSCQQKWVNGQKGFIKDFPPQMAGAWVAQVGYTDAEKYGIKFEFDGSISKIVHNVMGPIMIKDGGAYGEGPDKDTYFEFVLGPTMVEYDPLSKIISVEIIIDKYEMQLPQGELKGKIIDKLKGKVSPDGKTWIVEWRNYSYLEGADKPDIDFLDKNPDHLTFKKIEFNDPNSK